MCWSLKVSLAFAAVHLAAAACVAWRRPPHFRYFLSFLVFFSAMEVLQAVQWFTGVDDDFTRSCSKANTFWTSIAYIFIWLQPVLFVSFATRNDSRFAWYYSLYSLIVAMGNFLVGFYIKASGLEMMGRDGMSNYGKETCTYRGAGGHLVWKFAVASFNIQPTHYVYISIIALTIVLHYDLVLLLTVGLGWLFAFFLSVVTLGDVNGEFTSYWCLLSIFADIPIVIYTMMSRKRQTKQNIN